MSGEQKGGGGGGPMLRVTRLWRKRSAKGRYYLTGRLGGLRVLVFQREPDDGQEGDHTHTLMLASADPPAQGGGRTALAERHAVAREIEAEKARIAERRSSC